MQDQTEKQNKTNKYPCLNISWKKFWNAKYKQNIFKDTGKTKQEQLLTSISKFSHQKFCRCEDNIILPSKFLGKIVSNLNLLKRDKWDIKVQTHFDVSESESLLFSCPLKKLVEKMKTIYKKEDTMGESREQCEKIIK